MATQLTTTSGISPSMQSYYDRKMLEHAKTQFVFANYAQKRSIPKNNGKTVQCPAFPIAKKVHAGFSCDHHLLFVKLEFVRLTVLSI